MNEKISNAVRSAQQFAHDHPKFTLVAACVLGGILLGAFFF
jgi:hypothetical protein